MQCFNCKHDFCWMCLGNWRTHGSEYYECSRYAQLSAILLNLLLILMSCRRYKENPNIANESVHAQAREALKKYLHYFERVSRYDRVRTSLIDCYSLDPFQWENHSRSLKLEAVTLEKIKNRIQVRNSCRSLGAFDDCCVSGESDER